MTTRSSTKDEFLKYCKSESYYLTDEQFSGKEQIKYNLDLSGLTEIPENWYPSKVEGKIYIDEETGYDKKPILEFINFHI